MEPIHFSLIDADGIWDYVMLRQEYRATQINSNKLPKLQQGYGQSTESSILSSRHDEEESEYSEFDEADHEQKLGENVQIIPDTLLSQPLDQKQVNKLRDRQKRFYTI